MERGTVKRLRVVALEFRAAGVGYGVNRGPAGHALVSTPISINGAWDVKRVLGSAMLRPTASDARFRSRISRFQSVCEDFTPKHRLVITRALLLMPSTAALVYRTPSVARMKMLLMSEPRNDTIDQRITDRALEPGEPEIGMHLHL